MTRPVLVFGNQKSGTTAIAALLAKMTGRSCTLDIPPVWQHERELHSGNLPIAQLVTNYPEYFEKEVIKEPCLTFLYERVIEYFPDAAQVFVVRHPADNIRSILDRLGTPGALAEDIDIEEYDDYGAWRDVIGGGLLSISDAHYVDRLAVRWVHAVEVYLKHSAKMSLVRYESFLVDKVDVLTRLAQDLGLHPSQEIGELKDLQFQKRGVNRGMSWDAFFGYTNLARIRNITSPYLHYFDYDF